MCIRDRLGHPLFHERAVRVGKRVQHMTPRARERSHVAGLFLAFQCASDFVCVVTRVDRHAWLLIGEEDPIAILLRQFTPRTTAVVSECGQDVALSLSWPGRGPCGGRALANRE